MKTPHKHAELIKAWADGAEIECFSEGDWYQTSFPSWYEDRQYRIKPEPKPDVVRYSLAHFKQEMIYALNKEQDTGVDNLKLTFDGETGKLKSAEVLK